MKTHDILKTRNNKCLFRLFSFSEMIYCYIASDMNAAIQLTITEMKLEKLTSI